MEVRIIGIVLLLMFLKKEPKLKLHYFGYIFLSREILSKAEVFNHRKNDAARLTYDDISQKIF